ncbi:MAG: IS66 family transposase, partial [Acidobacteriota bacterium]
MVDLRSEHDIETVRQVALLLDRENERLVEQNKKFRLEIAMLQGLDPSSLQIELDLAQELLAQRERALFGRSSEKRPGPQGALSPEEAPKPQKGHGPKAQPVLPVLAEEHALPEDGRACPVCGGTLRPLGDEAEESEEITVVERRFVVVKHRRLKYRCTCNACVVTAPGPPKLIPGGRYSVEFAVEVAASKYLDHLPLERQTRIMAREGLDATSQTLWDQTEALARHLRPTYNAIRTSVLSEPLVHADETTWPYLGKRSEEKPGKFWTWCAATGRAVCYTILPSRSAQAAKEVLGDCGGIVMADGYSAYESLAKGDGSFALVHCWAHVRRKFVEAEPFFPEESGKMIALIGKLYTLEREVPRAGPETGEQACKDEAALRLTLRRERSRPVVREIQTLLMELKGSILPQSSLGKAVAYTMHLWTGLTAFLENGAIPLDNNGAERALRGVVVGRKNHYGSKSLRGTQVAALFYTLLESAKLCGVEPK